MLSWTPSFYPIVCANGKSWLSLWYHLHKITICSISASVAKQSPVQDEVWESSCNIDDLCESRSKRIRASYLCD